MQENSYRFFQNTACEYYPCHQGVGEDFNSVNTAHVLTTGTVTIM